MPIFSTSHSRWYGHVPITITLALAIGFLVLLSAGIVLGVGVWLAQKNTFGLISDNAHQAISTDVNQIEQHLLPAEYQARFIAGMISRGEIDQNDRDKFGTLLTGALAAVPQIEAIVFIDTELESFGAGRSSGVGQTSLSLFDNSNDKIIQSSMVNVMNGPLWVQPIWRDEFQKTYISRAHPVEIGGEFSGTVIAVVAVEQLSFFISQKGLETAGNSFILYGRDQVLAHWLMVDGYPDRSAEAPLPLLEQFSDPIISSMWQSEAQHDLGLNLPEGTQGHRLEALDSSYIFFYKTLDGFGPEPLIVGTYFQPSDRPEEIERLLAALVAGLLALLLSLIAAVYLGRRIARPIVEYSTAASRIRDLDLSKVDELPGSMIRELNDQSVAFNAMLRALRWFELYVPKKIVEQLIRHGNIQDSHSSTREITVMFTDVTGFSAISQGMLAEEVATFVNHHFSMVVSCIEKEEGVVDKFMGDAVLAFWPDAGAKEHSAERACKAAIASASAIRSDNRDRISQGKPPIGIRIGVHTGLATVGNIGAPGRLNYTIIGDTVNIGQRLEQLGKEVYPDGIDVSILISGDTANKLTEAFSPAPVGSHKLHGRIGEIDVYALDI